MDLLPLIGIVIVIVGFAKKWNSILIIMAAIFVTGLAGGISLQEILAALGKSFITNRNMAIFIVILPAIALLESNGLKESAKKLILKIKNASPGTIIDAYGVFRALLATFNINVGGVAGFVRPIVYPMAVASVEEYGKTIEPKDADEIKALASAMENVAWFFGQVLFIGAPGLLLVQGTLGEQGYQVELLEMVKILIPVFIIAMILTWSYVTFRSKIIMKKYTKEAK